MNDLSNSAKLYIFGAMLIGLGLIAWMGANLEWANPGQYLLAALGAVAQTLKVEGPNERTNYSVAWFIYGFAFITLGPASAIFVIVVSHLVEWIWHKYPWFIQSFNIVAHGLPLYLAGWVFGMITQRSTTFDLNRAVGIAVANLIFVLGNHFMVGLVVKLARNQSFADSGIFEFLTLFLDFTLVSMGSVTALIWFYDPFASLLNILPLYLLYHAIRVPALLRQLRDMKITRGS